MAAKYNYPDRQLSGFLSHAGYAASERNIKILREGLDIGRFTIGARGEIMEDSIPKLEITKTEKSYQGQGVIPSKDTLKAETKQHIADVSKALDWFGSQLSVRGKMHDHTKMEHFDTYYEEFCHWVKDGFDSGDINGWWKIHTEQERHHLKDHVPDDVNLIDIVEMCMDCGCAGLARSGSINPLEEGKLPEGLLLKAFNNTLKMLADSSVIKKEKKDDK